MLRIGITFETQIKLIDIKLNKKLMYRIYFNPLLHNVEKWPNIL